MSIIPNILRAISDYDMLHNGDSVVVAFSGGADSVSLLHALKQLEATLDITVSACHINHHLRGEESDSDMRYCRQLCAQLDIPIAVYDVDVTGSQQKHESTEECARKLRYQCFEKESAGRLLATAHNSNDSTETVLLNLMRGTGLKGLCGIPPIRGNIIRPLIYCTREEIERYCAENSLEYVTDKTNLSTDYTRNKVRHILLPEMLKINSSLYDTVSRMERSLREDSDYLEGLTVSALTSCRCDGGYKAKELAQLPSPIMSRAIKPILMDGGIEPSTLRINTAKDILISGRGKFNPCKGKFFVVRKGIAYVLTEEQHYRKHEKISSQE